MQTPRPDAFLPPRRRTFPDTQGHSSTPTGSGSLRARGARNPRGRGSAAYDRGPIARGRGCPHWLCSARNRDEGPGLSARVRVAPAGFLRRGGRATHTTHGSEVEDVSQPRPALREPLGETLRPRPRPPRRRLCFSAPGDYLERNRSRVARPTPCSLPRPCLLAWGTRFGSGFAQVREGVHSDTTRGSRTRNCSLSSEPAPGQGFSQPQDTCGFTAGSPVGQVGLPGRPPLAQGLSWRTPGRVSSCAALRSGHLLRAAFWCS